MTRLAIVVLCAGLLGPAMAADAVNKAPQGTGAAAESPPMADPGGADEQAVPASGVPATAPGGTEKQAAPGEQQVAPVEPKSSIPLEKRQGGDITECLEAGSKSDKDIAICAEKYRQHKRKH